MVHLSVLKNNFTSGVISPEYFGRSDLAVYQNGAKDLLNVDLLPSGGVRRRPGLRHVADISDKGRLHIYKTSSKEKYILLFLDKEIQIYENGTLMTTISSPWQLSDLSQLNFCQNDEYLTICHPDYLPENLSTKQQENDERQWRLEKWTFTKNEKTAVINQPYHRFADKDATLTPSVKSGTGKLTASHAHFTIKSVGTRYRIDGKEIEITAYQSPIIVNYKTIEALPHNNARKDWQEAAFSDNRGWPISVCFHQNRMVVGGSRDLPTHIWLSVTGEYYNFDLADGSDDKAISIFLLSSQTNEVRDILSAKHLQVFTTGGEWVLMGDPLTPSAIQAKKQTNIGSPADVSLPPLDINGATLFASRGDFSLREYVYTDLSDSYIVNDLALLSNQFKTPIINMAYDDIERRLYMVTNNGSIHILSLYKQEQVIGWSRYTTNGKFHSIANDDGVIYVIVERGKREATKFYLEKFDETAMADAMTAMSESNDGSAVNHQISDKFKGDIVQIFANDIYVKQQDISENEILNLNNIDIKNVTGGNDADKAVISMGLPFTIKIQPLLFFATNMKGVFNKFRLMRAIFDLSDTTIMQVRTDKNFRIIENIPSQNLQILSANSEKNTCRIQLSGFGWSNLGHDLPWEIVQSTPHPFTLLGVEMHISTN